MVALIGSLLLHFCDLQGLPALWKKFRADCCSETVALHKSDGREMGSTFLKFAPLTEWQDILPLKVALAVLVWQLNRSMAAHWGKHAMKDFCCYGKEWMLWGR